MTTKQITNGWQETMGLLEGCKVAAAPTLIAPSHFQLLMEDPVGQRWVFDVHTNTTVERNGNMIMLNDGFTIAGYEASETYQKKE